MLLIYFSINKYHVIITTLLWDSSLFHSVSVYTRLKSRTESQQLSLTTAFPLLSSMINFFQSYVESISNARSGKKRQRVCHISRRVNSEFIIASSCGSPFFFRLAFLYADLYDRHDSETA